MRLPRRALIAAALPPAAARAGEWSPDGPVVIVVPYARGGAADLLARVLAPRFADRLGQPVTVENEAGAQGTAGTQRVAQARPDGRTLLIAGSGPLTVSPAVMRSLPYRPLAELTPITGIAGYPLLLVVGGQGPFHTLDQLRAWSRSNPHLGFYGSASDTYRLAAELFRQRTETSFRAVAFDGNADIVDAVAEGRVTMALVDAASAAEAMQAGRIRALAIAAARRDPTLPDVPTMAEQGIAGVEVEAWSALLGPALLPAAAVARLAAEVAHALAEPDIAQRVAALRMVPQGQGPDALRTLMARELLLWRDVARAANLRFGE